MDGAQALRQSLHAGGLVQGVGFRPFVFQLAKRLGLVGFVRNEPGGVHIEVEGSRSALEDFARHLSEQAPPPARVEDLQIAPAPPLGEREFQIRPSVLLGAPELALPADDAPCVDCLRELFDPGDRRYRYPFLNCSHCGPRLTVIRGLPYDRVRTTLTGFPMCADCRREYQDPSDRRFHAEPTACPRCGPRLEVVGRKATDPADPIACAAAALLEGKLVAVKGAGGFHLACDATQPAAVATLRARKGREEKPFALMVADLAAAEALCSLTPAAAAALQSPARPIVLLPARLPACVAPRVAPGSALLGVMLPSTPLHHLLAREVRRPLVMTSGNPSEEPIAYEDADARTRLGELADLFLTHDRPIHLRCDDSVCRPIAGAVVPLRRSRGFAPLPTRLPFPLARPTLAVGGMLKSTFAFGAGRRAVASHHLGDLDHAESLRAFEHAIGHYLDLYRCAPARLCHDLHPDYPSTSWAQAQARERGLELLGIQHHHAHFASALLDARLTGPALGVVFDGSGYGADGTLWGGEFLAGDASRVTRRAHLAPAPLPGGDRAAREPWRVAVARLFEAGLPLDAAERRLGADRVRPLVQLLSRGVSSPPTSSVGRLFDAVAWLAGGADSQSFEGQAAMRLESLAAASAPGAVYPMGLRETPAALVLDPVPMVRALVEDAARGEDAPVMARRFHEGLARATAQVCRRLADETGLRDVVLTGGVFQNALLTELTARRLEEAGLRPRPHRELPPNDAGLALGQLLVAAARDGEG